MIQRVNFNFGVKTVQRLVKEFIQESKHNLTYCSEATELSILQRLANEDFAIFIADKFEDKTGGFIICTKDNSWHKESFGLVEKFYVAKYSRGTYVSRELIKAATDWFDANDCIKSFITDTAGIHSDKRLVNLTSKYGFIPCGDTLQRNKNE